MIEKAIELFLATHRYESLDVKAVLFDMDGVLFDSMPFHAQSWKKVMNQIGIHSFTEIDAYMHEGRTGEGTIALYIQKELGREASKEETQQIYRLKTDYYAQLPTAPVIPYTKELIEKITGDGLTTVLVTGSGQKSQLEKIDQHYPGFFPADKRVTAFDVERGKPYPEPYLKGLEKAGVDPHQGIVIENAPLGVMAAKAAGIFTIAVNTGPLDPAVLKEAGADCVFHSMEELYRSWKEIANKTIQQ